MHCTAACGMVQQIHARSWQCLVRLSAAASHLHHVVPFQCRSRSQQGHQSDADDAGRHVITAAVQVHVSFPYLRTNRQMSIWPLSVCMRCVCVLGSKACKCRQLDIHNLMTSSEERQRRPLLLSSACLGVIQQGRCPLHPGGSSVFCLLQFRLQSNC
jgi:ribosomal protein L40E